MIKRLAIAVGLIVFVAALFALGRYLDQIDVRAVISELRHFSLQRFAAAVLLVMGYLLLNSGNEVILCRAAGVRLPLARTLMIALIANPIGHSVGWAALSGGALRLRLYTALGVNQASVGYIAAWSMLPFLLGAAGFIALAMLSEPQQASYALHVPQWLCVAIGCILLGAVATLLTVAHRRRRLAIGNVRLVLPSTAVLLIELSIGMSEIALVAGVMYLFLPADIGVGYLGFVGLYLIAAMLAQLSNAPAGLGVLEAALITLLPGIEPKQLLAAIIGYRASFELLPLSLALLLLLLFEMGSRAGLLGRLWRTRISNSR